MSTTPFWLEIKTEYIDANLEKVIAYLSKETVNPEHDAFYDETVALLEKRVKELQEQIADKAIWEADDSADKAQDIAALQMLGAALLTGCAAGDTYFFFVKSLAALVPATEVEELVQVAVRSLACRVDELGFGWSDLKTVQPEVLAHKLLAAASFTGNAPDAWYQGKGSVAIRNGAVDLFAVNRDKAALARTYASLQMLDGLVRVQYEEKLQQKDEDNLEEVEKFTKAFIRDAAGVRPSPARTLKSYQAGDTAPVRFTGVDPAGNLTVETVEGTYEKIQGIIPVRSASVLFYTMGDFARAFRVGDVFDAKLLSENKKSFSLNEWFVKGVCQEVVETRRDVLAFLKDVNRGKMVWWTEDGYPAYSDLEAKPDGTAYEVGDHAIIYITSCSDNGYVYSSVVEPSDEVFDKVGSMEYCVGQCIYPEDSKFSESPSLSVLPASLAKGLSRLLFGWQRTVGQAAERFRILSVCRMLAEMTEDPGAREYTGLSCAYLKNLVAFASGHMDRIQPIEPSGLLSEVGPVILRGRITRLLQAYGNDEDNDFLSTVIHEDGADPILVQLAKLIQSCNRIDDVYPAIKTVIKREITKFLAVETEDNTDFEQAAGPNLGVENSRQEFKTSFFFPPKNAREQNQEKTIFRSLCSFLNTQEGGTLYLGVNDSGGINGLDNDLDYLQRRVAGSYKGIDGYIRYITDRARQWFDLDVRIHFKIESIYDGRVVSIRVEPYAHGVVEFDGTAYIRNNSESVKMGNAMRRQIEAQRLQAGLKHSRNVVALTEAIREERQVTLYSYQSSNSGDVRDRHLEPFAFVGNFNYVWAYDLDDGANKLFRVSRVGDVRIEEAWEHKSEHRKSPVDIFHFPGNDPIPVKLELDLLAKNLLTEEYPEAEKELSDLGDGRWLLDTKVYQIKGIGRFYTGLAPHIGIIDAPELVVYAKEYFAEAMKGLE